MEHRRLNKEYREITAPVLVPDEKDWHGDTYTEEEVLKACRNYQSNCDRANLQHLFDLEKKDAYFVEHYCTPETMTFGEGEEALTVKKGTWMATMKIENDKLWEKVQNGEFTGFSINADAKGYKLSKSKIAGRLPEDAEVTPGHKLFDIDFSKITHHVALVDEAANATKVLATKSKNQEENHMSADIKDSKDSKDTVAEYQLEELKKAKELAEAKDLELQKAKELTEAKDLELQKAKEEAEAKDLELKKFKEAKKAQELEVLVTKSKALKADEPDVFAVILQKCKELLEEKEYKTLEDQLSKLENIEKNKEFFDNKGDGESGKDGEASGWDAVEATKKKIMEDEKVPSHVAFKKACKKLGLSVAPQSK